MTFGEKLQRLRKQRGWTQEELAGKITVSRQALSKWESGSAIPDTENVLQLSKLFGVTTDYLLHDEYESDGDLPPVQETTRTLEERQRQTLQTLLGWMLAGLSALGMVILGILSSVYPCEFYIAPAAPTGQIVQETVYRGLAGFLKTYHLEWLFVLCLLLTLLGLGVVLWPRIVEKHKEKEK